MAFIRQLNLTCGILEISQLLTFQNCGLISLPSKFTEIWVNSSRFRRFRFYLINLNRNELLFISGKFETTKNQHLGNVWIHAITWGCKINAANNCKDQRRHLSCLSTFTFHETPCIDSRKPKNVTHFLFKYDGGLSRQTTSFLSSPQSQFVEVEFAQEPDKNLR